MEKDPQFSSELEVTRQGAGLPSTGLLLPGYKQASTEPASTGEWLGRPLTSSDEQNQPRRAASPSSPKSANIKGVTVLSPASPLETGCWSPSNKPLKKQKQSNCLHLQEDAEQQASVA